MTDLSVSISTVMQGNLYRIEDYYTRDRSTPRLDSVYGGHSDLTGAIGWEKDGETVIMFRKKAEATHGSDNSFQGDLKVIW